MTKQEIKAGDNSSNNQYSGHHINAPGGNVNIASDKKMTYEFIKEMTGIIVAGVLAVVSLLTNPSPNAHLNKVVRGSFSTCTLDRNVFYDNNVFYSSVYVLGKNNERIPLSYGYLGQVQESAEFNYNLERGNGC